MDATLQRLQTEIASLTSSLTDKELARRPQGKWSVGEILEHLYLTYTGTTKGFQRCLENGKPLATQGTWKQRVAKTVTVDVGMMPRGIEAPAPTRPKGLPLQTVLTEIGSKIEAMDQAIVACEERYGIGVKLLNHGILGAMTGPQWRKFHCVHGRHHLRQIAQLRRGNGDPGIAGKMSL
jgi:hypothetical protein